MANPMIMVIDDDFHITDMLDALLRQVGYDTAIAGDGDRALETLSRGRLPQLILLDLALPSKDGFMVLDAVKNDPQTKDIPVLVISGQDRVADVDKAIQMGAAEFVPKPLRSERLLLKIRRHLSGAGPA